MWQCNCASACARRFGAWLLARVSASCVRGHAASACVNAHFSPWSPITPLCWRRFRRSAPARGCPARANLVLDQLLKRLFEPHRTVDEPRRPLLRRRPPLRLQDRRGAGAGRRRGYPAIVAVEDGLDRLGRRRKRSGAAPRARRAGAHEPD